MNGQKENVKVNNFEDKPIRFLVDDVQKFVKREIRRGNKYDVIIMDLLVMVKGLTKKFGPLKKIYLI